jgi:hypothetical protein
MLGFLSYIAGISLYARYETRSHELSRQNSAFAVMLLLLPSLTHSCTASFLFTILGDFANLGLCNLTMLPFIIWTSLTIFFKRPVSSKVSRLLAGMPLADSVYLFSIIFACYLINGVEQDNLLILITPLIPLAAFLSALLLQKIAPAT